MKRRLFLLTYLITTLTALTCLEPRWVRVLSGEIVAGPITALGRVYAGCEDRNVICLSDDGSFLWSRSLSGRKIAYLTMSQQGLLLEVSVTGAITACNPDGLFLWRLSGGEVPLLPPYHGRDGRIFLAYRNRLVCVGMTGLVKWTASVDGNAILLSETQVGDLLLLTPGGILQRYSPYGVLLEKSSLPGETTLIHPAPSGFYTGARNGILSCYDVRVRSDSDERAGTELLWEYRGQSPCTGVADGERGTLCAAFADGTVAGLNTTDGSPLWTVHIDRGLGDRASLSYSYGQFNLVSSRFAAAVSGNGLVQWYHQLSTDGGYPVISENGSIFSPSPGWKLVCYLAETRILGEKKHKNSGNYGILSDGYSGWDLLLMTDRDEIYRFFARVERDIESGTVGPDEVAYARILVDVIQGRQQSLSPGRPFDGTERGRACSLLGKIGSTEYRDVLLAAARGEFDESFAIGILYGLSLSGPDPDGLALDAIAHLTKSAGVRNGTFQRFACSALYSIARYSHGESSLRAVAMLSEFTREPYGSQIREHALRIIGSLLDSN